VSEWRSYEVRCAECDVVICYASFSAMLPYLVCGDCNEKLQYDESAADGAERGGR
jgi:hypothetical protein